MRDFKYVLISEYLQCNRKSNATGGGVNIRLISSHDHKVEQKMTALFLAI